MTDWTPPAPGPWQQDSAHTPVSQSLIMGELYPDGFNRGFAETFGRYGMLLDRLAMATVNGFIYHQPQPFDMPGPDGPKSPEEIGAEFGRRAALAEETFRERRWRSDLEDWDANWKPKAIDKHLALDAVDTSSLDDEALIEHLEQCASHLTQMAYQHHRFNVAAVLPVGDLALHFAQWAGQPPTKALAVLDGYSPISNVASDEMSEALNAIRNAGLEHVANDGAPADERLARLRELPEVDRYVRLVRNRTVDGFDVTSPTVGEHPELIVGRIASALDTDPNASRVRSDATAAELRELVPEAHRDQFDDLVAEARYVYRLRDERGLYSDITAIGLMRRALLEVGRRASERGDLASTELALDANVAEAKALVAGSGPSSDELAARSEARRALTAAGPPRYLGDPPPPPPPVDELPPELGRLMGGVGFIIDAILGQLDAAEGDDTTIGGIGVGEGVAEGPARLISGIDDLLDVEPGDIIVAPSTSEAFNSVLHLVAGIVTDHGSHACHAAIVAREMGFPAVVGTVDGTKRIAAGAQIRLDGANGEVVIIS